MSKNERPKSTDRKLRPVEIYYDRRSKGYIFKLNGRYQEMSKEDIKLNLKTYGYSDAIMVPTADQGSIKEIETPFHDAMNKRMIEYSGSLAGHRAGAFTDSAKRTYLVTDEAHGVWDELPKKITPPEFFLEFIQELLPDGQWMHFCHWLAIALKAMRNGTFSPGQVCIFAGPAQCGKSLLQKIITEVLGGRKADPFAYMMGEKFSYDLVGAEHWATEDPDSTTDLRARRSLGEKMKECSNNEDFKIHQKGKDALSARVFRRITFSVNIEPENLAVCPVLGDGTGDKINLYKCGVAKKSLERFIVTETNLALAGFEGTLNKGEFDRSKVGRVIQEELPMIRAWLIKHAGNVPVELRDNRCGIRFYHHPELFETLCNMQPEVRFLSIIDEIVFDKNNPMPWTGRAVELEKELRKSDLSFAVEKILRWPDACGAYLGKLMKSYPNRVSDKTVNGYRTWIITTPKH